MEAHGLYIGGRSVPPTTSAHADPPDPATNRPRAKVAAGSKADVDAAVEAARQAFESPEWRDLDPSKRGRLLWLLGQQVRDRFDELARLRATDVGKTIPEG